MPSENTSSPAVNVTENANHSCGKCYNLFVCGWWNTVFNHFLGWLRGAALTGNGGDRCREIIKSTQQY